MLPDLRLILGSVVAALILVTASIGMLASVRVAQNAIDPLARTSLTALRSTMPAPWPGTADGKRAEQVAELSRKPIDLTGSIPDAPVIAQSEPNDASDDQRQNEAAPQAASEPEQSVGARQGEESDRTTQSQDAARIDKSPRKDALPAAGELTSDPATTPPAAAAVEPRPPAPETIPEASDQTTATIPVDGARLPKARPATADLPHSVTLPPKARTAKVRRTRARVRTAARAGTAATWSQYQWQQPWQAQTNGRAKTQPTQFLLGPQQGTRR